MLTEDGGSSYVLGVNTGVHDCAAALLRNGELIAMVEEERLSRRRHALFEAPSRAIGACLAEAGVGLEAVSQIAVGWDIPAVHQHEGIGDLDEAEFLKWLLSDSTPPGKSPALRFVDHHLAHAASAFHTSGFEEAAVLIVDGHGERMATTIAAGGPSGIEVIRTWGTNLSLGALYASAAEWCGLTPRGAGKLMGLASYGRARQSVPLRTTEDGYTIVGAPPAEASTPRQLRELRHVLRESFRANFPYGQGDGSEPMAHADFAASIQAALQEVILRLAAIARRETGHAKLVMAGGVALNCTANGALIRSGIFDEVWVPPVPYDAGVSLGAALVAERDRGGPASVGRRLPHAFWAPRTDGPDAEALARLESECVVTNCGDDELPDIVGRHLAEGRLVGWWQGRAEVGQRALGARSILCDPRSRRSLVRANLVKGRESWRPLAPAILAEHTAIAFDHPLPAASDFMLAAWPVRESARSRLPAGVHIDGSARPQVVWPSQTRYHGVIESFFERTGVPAIINTSFNLAGKPIVHSAQDAIDTFMRSELDVLVLDHLVAEKIRPTDSQATEKDWSPDTRFFAPWAKGSRHS